MVISDSRAGLTEAIAKALIGKPWPHCRLHSMRNMLAHIQKGHKSMAAATAMRTRFAQHSQVAAREQLVEIVRVM